MFYTKIYCTSDIKAFYYNTDKNALILGINVYQNMQTGLTEIFFLVNE